jgi:hypothetical protein
MKFQLEPATDKKHRWVGVFTAEDGTVTRTPFGDATMENFTIHRNPLRKERYLSRHRSRENWRDPKTAGALSRWILWNEPTIAGSIKSFKRRFNLE